ncbi:MAG: hypothetical protein Q9203_004828 [Teloschistes exilis]
MEWLDAWSGFEGEGMYAFINKKFQQSLSFAELPDNRYLTGSPFVPCKPTMLWKIWATEHKDVYAIENFQERVLCHTIKKYQATPDRLKFLPRNALWIVDCAISLGEPGKPVVFRNIGYPGLVLDLQEAVPSGAYYAILRRECEAEGDRAEERQCQRSQQWYLQKQTSEILLQIADDWAKVFLDREKATSTERSDSGDEK